MPTPIVERVYGKARVRVYENKEALGKAAALAAGECMRRTIDRQGSINLLFSTGASQFEFVAALRDEKGIRWNQANAFHLDEYKAMKPDHPASFRLWLRTRVDEPLRPGAFHYIGGDAADAEAECARYAELLTANPIDLAFIGIGENGHIAFNDPPVADFADRKLVKVVELDEACRKQQLGEGWFPTLDSVPREAITLTVPDHEITSHHLRGAGRAQGARRAAGARGTDRNGLSGVDPAHPRRCHDLLGQGVRLATIALKREAKNVWRPSTVGCPKDTRGMQFRTTRIRR